MLLSYGSDCVPYFLLVVTASCVFVFNFSYWNVVDAQLVVADRKVTIR